MGRWTRVGIFDTVRMFSDQALSLSGDGNERKEYSGWLPQWFIFLVRPSLLRNRAALRAPI